jgi:hypothetical protein
MRFLGLILCSSCLFALPGPRDWVPARWTWTDPATLDLLTGTPVNCVLVEWSEDRQDQITAFTSRAGEKGIATLAVIRPGPDPAKAARGAVNAKLQGVVLEGDFPANTADRVRDVLTGSKAVVVELTSRRAMKLNGDAPIIGTYQGVWPGIQVLENGEAKAGPTGSPWIDTNSGFIRAVRSVTSAAVWLGNMPPEKMVITAQRYAQAVSDAEMVGARWVIALDADFAGRLRKSDPAAHKDWKLITDHLKFFEDHPDWRSLQPFGKLAVVEDVEGGGLLSGGILDMIAAKHTPVRPVPPQKLSTGALKGASMAVNVDSQSLSPEQRQILRSFTRSGGTLLTGPPGWKQEQGAAGNEITYGKAELERLDEIWRDVQSMIGRKNLGARLFNVSSMLSNLMASPDGNTVVVHLVNYSGYPVESVTVHLLGDFKHATLYTTDGKSRPLDVYKNEEGTGVDIDTVSVCASLRLD